MDIFRKITVEPAMFLQQAGDTLTYVIFQNLFIDKICKVQLNYEDDVCKLYETMNADTELNKTHEFMGPIMNSIQQKSSDFLLYNSLVENSLPVILVLFLGVWSDANRRRKPCLLLSLLGKLLRSLGLLLNAYFIDWSPIVLLFTVALPHSMGGANGVFHMAAFSYVADSSVPRSRTWRLGVAEACWQLGSPVGLFLGAFLFEEGGYICVFSTAVTFHLIAVLYTAFILPEVPQPKVSQYSIGKYGSIVPTQEAARPQRKRYFSENQRDRDSDDTDNEHEKLYNRPTILSQHPRGNFIDRISGLHNLENNIDPSPKTGVLNFLAESFRAVLRERPNHTRKCLISLGVIMLLYGIATHGEVNLKYLFTRNKFQWREQEFSVWTVFDSCMIVLGLTIVLPIFSRWLRFSDAFAGAFAALGRALSRICIALASSSEYLFIAVVIDIGGVLGPLSARSIASKSVLRDERGKVFAFLGCIEALVPLIAVPLYSLIYSSTLVTAPSTIYFVSAGICFIIFIIFSILFISSKMNIIQLTGTDTSALISPVHNPNERHSHSDIDPGFFINRRFSLF